MPLSSCLYALVVQTRLLPHALHDVVFRGHDDCVEEGAAERPRVLFYPQAPLDDDAHQLRGVLAKCDGLLFGATRERPRSPHPPASAPPFGGAEPRSPAADFRRVSRRVFTSSPMIASFTAGVSSGTSSIADMM